MLPCSFETLINHNVNAYLAAFLNCCSCTRTPTQFVDMMTPFNGGCVPVEQRAPIKELLSLQVDGGRVAPAAGEMVCELFAAIRAKNKDRVRELLEMEADVNAYEPVPCPHPLQFLGWLLCLPFIVLMIICPCIGWLCIMLNDTDNYKKTPLHVAMTKDDPDMVALLLEFGADRNAPATYLNCCCCKKTPAQFTDMMIGDSAEQEAPIKELLIR